jgi:hypothetical protein
MCLPPSLVWIGVRVTRQVCGTRIEKTTAKVCVFLFLPNLTMYFMILKYYYSFSVCTVGISMVYFVGNNIFSPVLLSAIFSV